MNNQEIKSKLGFKILILSNYEKKKQNILKQIIKNNGFIQMREMEIEELFEVIDFQEPKIRQIITEIMLIIINNKNMNAQIY